jgi:hypothetical protein
VQWQRLPFPFARVSGWQTEGIPEQSAFGSTHEWFAKKQLQPADIQPAGQFWLAPPPSAVQPGQSGRLVVKVTPPDEALLPLPVPPAASSGVPNVELPFDDVQATGMEAATVSPSTAARAP